MNLEGVIQETGGRVTRGPLPRICFDATQLTQLFQNLIGNAVKFRSQDSPKVDIRVSQVEGGWVFSIRDNGLGIDPEHKDTIFHVFRRLHSRDKYPGSGIGLAICKRIVERHGGEIWVDSTPGQGSTFYFSVPDQTERTAFP
jgi:light-regulated signal transduction histidine kinase (bacteriophytochrome)